MSSPLAEQTVYPSLERITLLVKHLPWLKNITAHVQGAINVSAEHFVKNRQNCGVFSPSLLLESKQNTLIEAALGIKQLQHYGWNCAHRGEAVIFAALFFFFLML